MGRIVDSAGASYGVQQGGGVPPLGLSYAGYGNFPTADVNVTPSGLVIVGGLGAVSVSAGGGGGTGGLTDSAIHPPPTTGAFAFNTFVPGSAGFPAVGQSYVDPVFGSTVRRISDRGQVVSAGADDMYAHHWANANGTMIFDTSGRVAASLAIIDPLTGSALYSGQPVGSQRTDLNWDPLDPDKYYFFSGASLMRRNLAAQTSTTMHTFPGTLQFMGGTANWIDKTGTYFVVLLPGQLLTVWNKNTGHEYTGHPPGEVVGGGGYEGMTPSGKYVVVAKSNQFQSYLVDHVAETVSTTMIMSWSQCGDHGAFVSASNGHEYAVTFDCNLTGGVWRVDLELNQPAGISQAASNAQHAANQLLVGTTYANGGAISNDGHLSSVGTGPFTDWCFFDSETITSGGTTDPFNGGVSGWVAFEQEIIAINVVTLVVRRLAHHRSRGLQSGTNYWHQPRLSCSWDGSLVLWDSDMNINVTDYADMYGILNPNLS